MFQSFSLPINTNGGPDQDAPHTVYTTEEVEEIRQEYEVKLQRLKADKRKVEREKEMLKQKMQEMLQPLMAEFCPSNASLQTPQVTGDQLTKVPQNGEISSILIGRAPTLLRSHWSRLESSRVLKYFHALKGPITCFRRQ